MAAKLKRFLSLCAVFAGAMLSGYGAYQGWQRGLASDLEIANWDPVIAAACGAGVACLGVLSWLYFVHAERGLRRRAALLNALRGLAVLALSACEMGGLVAAIAMFITFAALERSGDDGLWALGVCVCGAVAHAAASSLLPWVRGKEEKSAKEIAAVFEDRDDEGR